jgi:hypothetical protein
MFRPISGHPRVHNWRLKHTEEEIHINYSVKELKLLKYLKSFWSNSNNVSV